MPYTKYKLITYYYSLTSPVDILVHVATLIKQKKQYRLRPLSCCLNNLLYWKWFPVHDKTHLIDRSNYVPSVCPEYLTNFLSRKQLCVPIPSCFFRKPISFSNLRVFHSGTSIRCAIGDGFCPYSLPVFHTTCRLHPALTPASNEPATHLSAICRCRLHPPFAFHSHPNL